MAMIPSRLITPTQLALFSRSAVIGAWWEEVHATDKKGLRVRRPRHSMICCTKMATSKHTEVLIA